jgi:hypothetical protein
MGNHQPNGSEVRKKSRLESILPYTTVAIILVALYVAWVFYSRHERTMRAQAEIDAAREDARKRVVNQIYGSGEIKFTTFGVDSGVLHRGESTQLCYGLVNAASVKIDPPLPDVKVSYHHCIEIAPKATTTYTITAQNTKGDTKSESITVQVK